MKKLLLICFSIALWGACQSPASSDQANAEDHEQHDDHEGHDHGDESDDAGDGIHFGELIDEDGADPYEVLLATMTDSDSVATKVLGTVDKVCQVKGCWMTISAPTEDGEPLFVQFKDYGFFMPKDISGRQVILDGYAYREVTSVDDLKHFAEDEGKSAEEVAAITEPKEEIKFMASGVILVPEEGQ